MELYWSRLLDIYYSLSDTFTPRERWEKAYRQMQEEMGTYKEPGIPPSFYPQAQTPQEFASQYAEAIVHMESTHMSQLTLPKDFMTRWNKVAIAAKKEG